MPFVSTRSLAGILLCVVGFFVFRHLISSPISLSLVIENEIFFIIVNFSLILIILGWCLNLFIAFVVLSVSASGENPVV